jgi:ketosteroid isomerase-like protein
VIIERRLDFRAGRAFNSRGGRAWRWTMGDRDDFLGWVHSRLRDAEIALHNGDAAPRRAIWSRNDPVTVFGAWRSASGQEEVNGLFGQLGAGFTDCRSYEHEIVAADVVGDMAYTVGYEHTQASVDGEARTYTLRATQVYRHENGEWKVVHRHADTMPEAGQP